MREPGSGTRAIFEGVLREHNYTLDSFARVHEISDFTVLKALAADGLGISFVYAPVAAAECRQGTLATFALDGIEIRREFNFVYLHDDLFLDIWQGLCTGSLRIACKSLARKTILRPVRRLFSSVLSINFVGFL